MSFQLRTSFYDSVVFRRPIIFFTSLVLVMTTLVSGPAKAGRIIDPSTEALGLLFTENMELTSMTSAIFGRTDQTSALDWKLCSSVSDPICQAADEVSIIQFFAPCPTKDSVNCISSTWAKSKNGSRTEGVYQRHLPASGTGDFPGEPRMKLPSSKGAGYVVRFPGVEHSGGNDEYLIALRNQPTIWKKSGESVASYEIGVQGIVGGITPIEVETGSYSPLRVKDGYGSDYGMGTTLDGSTCVATDDGICAAARDFPSDFRFGMTIRLSQKLTGWFHGRITTPVISTQSSDGVFQVSIEANPVRVATLDFTVPTSTLSQEIKDMIFNGEEWGASGNNQGTRIVTGLEEERAQTLLRLFTPSFEDKATRTSEYWTFKTLGDFRDDSVRRCTDQSGLLAGVVTTNALLYSAGPPSFNSSESSLDYKVAAPHFESTGREASGTYDLLIRSDVARCIYGFTKAPIRASLEVLSSDGNTKVATTTINDEDGWLSMSAAGFGFSSPILRARISQANSKNSRKATIVCRKGSAKKKIVAIKPECPKGWKRQS